MFTPLSRTQFRMCLPVSVVQSVCTFGTCADVSTDVTISVVFKWENDRGGMFPAEARIASACSDSTSNRATVEPTNALGGSVAGGTGTVTVVLKRYLGGTVATATADAAGRYRFEGLGPGVYLLEATDGAGRSSGPQGFNVPAGSDQEEFTLDLALK
jgi:hypothetical protein